MAQGGQKRNYQKEMEGLIEGFRREGKRPRLLLHSCCAPCSSYVNVVTPEGNVESVMLREHIDALLGDLKERERQVIVLRFGLEDGHPRTLEEVGKEFNVTRERIRQIEAKALRKLRNPVRSKRIRDFL